MRPLSERTVRTTIGMMRSMANCKPISPFHLEASYEMEKLLEEVFLEILIFLKIQKNSKIANLMILNKKMIKKKFKKCKKL